MELYIIVAGALSFLLMFSSLIAYKTHLKIGRQTDLLNRKNQEIQQQNNEISRQDEQLRVKNIFLEQQYDRVRKVNEELAAKNAIIVSSVEYAKRIQSAVLPSIERMQKQLPEIFVLYCPKDGIGGDFYWFHENDSKIYFAVADCTGHGIPGALMAMLGNSILTQIVESTLSESPALILKYLNKQLRDLLANNARSNDEYGEGMEITLCLFERGSGMLKVSSTNRPFVIIRNNELQEIRIRGRMVGAGDEATYHDEVIALKHDDQLYFFTDGITDQFDFMDRRKYSLKRLKTFLLDIQIFPFAAQRQLLRQELLDWQGTNSQTDDMLVFGFRYAADVTPEDLILCNADSTVVK